MGRFARSNNLGRVKARFVRPRSSANLWARNKTTREAQSRTRSKLEQRVFKLALIVVLTIVGACSGWMTGELFLGTTSQKDTLQPAALIGNPAPDKTGDSIPSQVAQAGTDETARDQVEERGAESGRETVSDQNLKEAGAQRSSKGHGFEPTSIVTKPVKVIGRPIKKLNPFKKLF